MTLYNSLRGRRIAIPAHADIDRLAAMFEEFGAQVERFPLMDLLDVEDPGPVQKWLRPLAADPFQDTVFLTGQGVARLMATAGQMGATEPVLEALRRTSKVTRGAKPARVLYELGLSVERVSAAETIDGVIDCFRGRHLAGRRVGVQLFGDGGGHELLQFLRAKDALVHPVAPYRYEASASATDVEALIKEVAHDRFHAVVFTTAMQVDRLFEVALRRGIEGPLRAGLWRVQVVAVGREVVSALEAEDVAVDIDPPRQSWMRHVVTALISRLGRTAEMVSTERPG